MKNKFLKLTAFLFMLIITSSCNKTSPGLGGVGINVVAIPTYENILSYDLVAGTQSLSIIQVNRDIPNSDVLATSQTVQVTLDPTIITAYNTANGTAYTVLPSTVYSFDASNPATAGVVTMTFAAGEFSKSIVIKMDLTQLPAGSNALGFTVTQTSVGQISKGLYKGFVAIGAKNRFDGKYTLTGTMVDAFNANLTGNYPNDVELRSNGPLQVNLFDKAVPGLYHSILNAGSPSYYGSFGVQITFNTDNTVASVVNIYGQPSGNGRSCVLDATGVNKWDPITKKLRIKYFMDQPTVTPGHRTSFDETYTYAGAR